MDSSLPGSSAHGDSPGKNTGVDCHFLFQGIFPIQGSNLCFFYHLYWPAGLPLAPPNAGRQQPGVRHGESLFASARPHPRASPRGPGGAPSHRPLHLELGACPAPGGWWWGHRENRAPLSSAGLLAALWIPAGPGRPWNSGEDLALSPD